MARLEDDHGFTLIEALIAGALLATVTTGVARLVMMAIDTAEAARRQTSAILLANQKLEELRALEWTWDGDDPPAARTDTTTDLAVHPASGGGLGLLPSPEDTLFRSTPGYVDYLDGRGVWVGTGVTPPAAAVYVRRWNVARAAIAPDDVVALQVLVTTVRQAAVVVTGWRATGREALVATLKARKSEGGPE